MNILMRWIVKYCFCAIVFCASHEDVDNKLNSKSIFLKPGIDWESVFSSWVRENKITGGILLDGDFLHRRRVKENSSSLPAAVSGSEMLARLQEENPRYTWRTAAGAVNILPKDLRKSHLRPLGRRTNFSTRAITPQHAVLELFEKERMPAQLSYYLGGPRSTPGNPQIYECNDVTILECVNLIAKRGAGGFWFIHYNSKLKKFVIARGDYEIFRDRTK